MVYRTGPSIGVMKMRRSATRVLALAGMVCLPLATSVAVDGQPSADIEKPTRVRLTLPQHHEIRSALFLHRLLKETLDLDEQRAHAIDLVFADFYRRTVENLPRPIFLAYRIGGNEGVSTDREDRITAESGQHTMGETMKRPDGTPVFLLELLIAEIKPEQERLLRQVVDRWNAIKPNPVDLPITRLMRAVRDPRIKLLPGQRRKIEKILYAKMPKGTVTKASVGPLAAAEPKVRQAIMKEMTPPQQEELLKTLVVLEADLAEWRSTRRGGAPAYENALKLLEAEKKKKVSGD